MAAKKVIGFIGAGNMAQAMMKGIKSAGIYSLAAFDTDSAKLKEAVKKYGAEAAASNAEIPEISDFIVLAVKPQSIAEALEPLKTAPVRNKTYISVAAGVTLRTLEKMVKPGAAIVRVMPNTPALVGEGACGWCINEKVTLKTAAETEKILNTFCKYVCRVDEEDMNSVTALSGSGPAYFFYIAEAFMEAAKAVGFDPDKAKLLMAQTMTGAGRMIIETGEDPEVLRQKVTSKGGTTEKGIRAMEEHGIKEIFRNVVIAAKKRADEMGKGK